MSDDLGNLSTGNGIDRDLAATGNDRLKKAVLELRELKGLVSGLIQFGKSSDRYARRLYWLTWSLVGLTGMLVVLTVALLVDARSQVSSQNNIALSAMFFDSINTGIISNIENGQPILVENKGKFTDAELDNYLGDFDTIDDAYAAGLLSMGQLCDSFSYYVTATWDDAEVQKYLAENTAYFKGLPHLVHIVASSTDSGCQ